MNAIHLVLHVIYLVGAVCFIVFPFDRSRIRAPWARWIFWTVAVLVLVLAVNGFGWDLQLWSYHILSDIRGLCFGVNIALIVSGQL